MKRYALIGKDIQHSLSPVIYKELIKEKHVYELIDIKIESELPTIEDLSQGYDGVNITSPYKEYYFEKKQAVCLPLGLEAVNCISFSKKNIRMTNTDYLAVKRILFKEFIEKFAIEDYFILGDGVMSRMLQMVLVEQKIEYEVINRKNGLDINSYDFSRRSKVVEKYSLIINCCAREFNFRAEIDNRTMFWDMNYGMPHADSISRRSIYLDGYSLLYEQAKEAVNFWNYEATN